MPLKKSKADVPLTTGLQQKTAAQRLPVGAAAKAVNYLKDKNGRLVKRLGFQPLNGEDPFGTTFRMSEGLQLATWGPEGAENLLAVGRGTWPKTGATVTVLQKYSDDLGAMATLGPMPDVKVTLDAIVANVLLPITNVCCASIGDVIMFAGIAYGTSTTNPGSLYWWAIERSTGNTLVAPSLGVANTLPAFAQYVRLVAVGSTFVICWSEDVFHPTVIQCATIPLATLLAAGAWTGVSGGIVNTNIADPFGNGNGYVFDMRAVGGDASNFILAYAKTGVGEGYRANIVVDQFTISVPIVTNGFVAEWAVATVTSGITAFGIRADANNSNRVVCSYSLWPSGTSYVIYAAIGNYPAMTTQRTPTTLYTSQIGGGGGSTGGIEGYSFPTWMDVTYGGMGISTGNVRYWTVMHSIDGATWCAWTGGSQSSPGRAITNAQTQDASGDARIIGNQFFEGAGGSTSAGVTTSGADAFETPGVILASRGVEANGIAYYLGWIPSYTQGSFIILAYDAAANPNLASGSTSPMRPVGILQTRTALADPGISNTAGMFQSPTVQGPNYWTGGSEWALSGDAYGTANVAYVGGERGQRLQPAYGAIQMQPTTGFPAAEWGTMTSFGGALPTTYDGQNAVEQNFLYAPESIAIQLGAFGQSSGPTWYADDNEISWILTWEWFDAQGNFHQSARSSPITINGAGVKSLTSGTYPITCAPTFFVPSLGSTLKQWPTSLTDMIGSICNRPSTPPSLGVYRTGVTGTGAPSGSAAFGQVFLRTNDRFYNNADPLVSAGGVSALTLNVYPAVATGAPVGPFEVTYVDITSDGTPGSTLPSGLVDGTHPELYDDGTNGAPGSLDNYCPPASNVMVRHKERLFVARGNQVLFTKQRGFQAGPGYNEQVNAFFVGNSDPVVAMQSQDGQLVLLKRNEAFYVAGDGPADDGSGAQFANPQPIPTDLGCVRPEGTLATPEGIYYQSTGGYRRVNRSFQIEYVGGPVEDELLTYPVVLGAVLYPQNNRLILLANGTDYPLGSGQLSGELVTRDYVLDAWTTGVLNDGDFGQKGFVAACVATALGGGGLHTTAYFKPTLHLLTADGVVWREHFPQDANAYFDNDTYVSATWLSAMMVSPAEAPGGGDTAQGRFRLWDILAQMISNDPHGLIISVGTDYGAPTLNRTWVWNSATGQPSIAPGGTLTTPTTQLRTYHGLMGEAFQVQIEDVSDPNSVNGQGATLLGLTVAIGTMPGPYKLPPTATQ